MKRTSTLAQHLFGWVVCSMIVFLILELILGHLLIGKEKLGKLEETVLGTLLFPMGATELICASLHVNPPSSAPLVVGCAAWGLVLYGLFRFIQMMRHRYL